MSAHGITTIYTLRRFYILMRRTIISHFSFLISHSSEVFKCNQRNGTPQGLTLNPQAFLFSLIISRDLSTYAIRWRISWFLIQKGAPVWIEKNESEPPLPAKKSTAYRSLPRCTSPHSNRPQSSSLRQKSISQKNLNLKPWTLNPEPWTLNLEPWTLNPEPWTLNLT